MQAARWIRLGEPIPPGGATVTGRGGIRFAEYGVGQSLVLMPFDAIAGATALPVFRRAGMSAEKQRQAAEVVTAFLMQALLTAGVLMLAYCLLTSLEFSPLASTAGAVALLFGTTCLTYVQNAQENLLLLFLALAALCALGKWESGRALVWYAVAGAACGFALLVRPTSCMELLVIAALGFLWSRNARLLLAGFAPPVAIAGFGERWYQWHRFGEWFSTYAGVAARQQGGTVSLFPYPFWKGFWRTVLSPDKSVLLFDPLLLLLAAIAVWRSRVLKRELRILLAGLAALYLLYSSFYAKYHAFGGDVAWGHRYVALPVQLLALFAVPMLVSYGDSLRPLWRRAAWLLVACSVAIQALSTTMALNLEVLQREKGFDKGVLWNRIVNVAELAMGTQDARRLAGVPVEWRGWNYLPFELRLRFPGLAPWAIAGWMGLLICLPILVVATLRHARRLTDTRRPL
jgi:hypothetical protein